jgi:hypothetical protein
MIRLSNREKMLVEVGTQVQTSWQMNDGDEGNLNLDRREEFGDIDAARDFVLDLADRYDFTELDSYSPENGFLQVKTEPRDSSGSFVTIILTLDNFDPGDITSLYKDIEQRRQIGIHAKL